MRHEGRVRADRLRATARLLLPYAVFLAILLLVPAVFTRVPLYTMGNGVYMAILAIAALGLVPLTGFAGQISLGQAAFFGTGAYFSAILTVKSGLPATPAAILGMATAGAAAYLFGRYLFRVSGHYLALATLGLGLVLTIVASQLEITGGTAGVVGVPSLAPFGVELFDDVSYYYLVAAVLLVAVVVVDGLVRSWLGRSLTAVGDAPHAAASSGIDIAARKRLAFVVAAVLAAAAGSLYAHWAAYVDHHTMDLLLSLQLLIIATVGGIRTVWGPVVGAFVVVTLLQVSQELFPELSERVGGQAEIVLYGLALILVLLFLPKGLAGWASDVIQRLTRARAGADEGGAR
ncbi:MAG: branched-chain amino acid ABC transporter permease [Micromonosporaceae bacterium]|nr:branched-chain amino acid ABC transporter permease [Micromonosporaceae bacterium]